MTLLQARVANIWPQSPAVGVNMHVTPGIPFSKQPSVLVTDLSYRPVANATVTVFASEYLNFFQEWVPEAAKTDRSDGTALHHARGQNYALLSGATSALTGADGIATWTDLTLLASSSKYLYLMFYCEGAVASWNDPAMSPPVPGRLPRPPRYVSPIYVDSPIAAVQYLDPTSSSSLSPVDCSGDYELPIVVEGELIAGSSGGALAAPRVRVLDASGAPLAGVQVIANRARYDTLISPYLGFASPSPHPISPVSPSQVMAVVHTAGSQQLPNLGRPENWRLDDPSYGRRVRAECNRWLTVPSDLAEDSAPSASLDHLKAWALSIQPAVPPEQLGRLP